MYRPTKYSELTVEHIQFLEELATSKNYQLCDQISLDQLVEYTNDNNTKIKICPDALKHFLDMRLHAKIDGIFLDIYYGFRDIDFQTMLFFGNYEGACDPIEVEFDAKQYLARMRWVAPPRYSEHHTGKAVDIINDNGKTLDQMENEPEFKWLLANAYRYGFTLSYPKKSNKGVGFEPWHWLFVG